MKDIHQIAKLGVRPLDTKNRGVNIQEVVKSSPITELKKKHTLYPKIM